MYGAVHSKDMSISSSTVPVEEKRRRKRGKRGKERKGEEREEREERKRAQNCATKRVREQQQQQRSQSPTNHPQPPTTPNQPPTNHYQRTASFVNVRVHHRDVRVLVDDDVIGALHSPSIDHTVVRFVDRRRGEFGQNQVYPPQSSVVVVVVVHWWGRCLHQSCQIFAG